jgi:hypothetical protein
MFEYSNNVLIISGFKDIKYIDDNKIEVVYARKRIIVLGKMLKVTNLLDCSLELRGVIESINQEYFDND